MKKRYEIKDNNVGALLGKKAPCISEKHKLRLLDR